MVGTVVVDADGALVLAVGVVELDAAAAAAKETAMVYAVVLWVGWTSKS